MGVDQLLQLSHRPLYSTTSLLLDRAAEEKGVALHRPALRPTQDTLRGHNFINNILSLTLYNANFIYNTKYCIAGKFGGELSLAVWRSILQSPN